MSPYNRGLRVLASLFLLVSASPMCSRFISNSFQLFLISMKPGSLMRLTLESGTGVPRSDFSGEMGTYFNSAGMCLSTIRWERSGGNSALLMAAVTGYKDKLIP